MKTHSTEGRWYAGSDAGTSPSCFFLTYARNCQQEQLDAFRAVSLKLVELSDVRDANGDFVVELIFARPLHDHPVVAYRFTSDWAERRYGRELTAIGSSLGRGTFEPFSADSGEAYYNDLWFHDKAAA